MERFAFKVDDSLRANLYKICRLCGIDHPSKVPILEAQSTSADTDEPNLSQKIFELVGFKVSVEDKMPPTLCCICMDKINDFYEFREMCYATNQQTRTLLGLAPLEPLKLMMDAAENDQGSVSPAYKRGRKRKVDANAESVGTQMEGIKKEVERLPTARKKQRLTTTSEIKDEPPDIGGLLGRKGRKCACNICGEKFSTKDLMEDHKRASHLPHIPRYVCYACDQLYNNSEDIKAHHLWHKLSKEPYKCPVCDAALLNNYSYSRHMREHAPLTSALQQVPDRKCLLCEKTFVTNFFYNTHPCAIRARKCGGCDLPLSTTSKFKRHSVRCPKVYLNQSKHIQPDIKIEADVESEAAFNYNQSPMENQLQPYVLIKRMSSKLLQTANGPNRLGASKSRNSSKSILKRADELLKNTVDTINTLSIIKHEPEMHINDPGPPIEDESLDLDAVPSYTDFDDFRADSDESEDEKTAEQTPIECVAHIKQESKFLGLKLKITKNDGQLNSSIVSNDNEEVLRRNSKKKKKRKRKERNRTSNTNTPTSTCKLESAENCDIAIVHIKQEPSYEDYDENGEVTVVDNPDIQIKQEALDGVYGASEDIETTAFPNIPMVQLYNNFVSRPETQQATPENEDIKPSRSELENILQLSHKMTKRVDIAEEAITLETAIEAIPENSIIPEASISEVAVKSKLYKSTARKRTAGRQKSQEDAANVEEDAVDALCAEQQGFSNEPSISTLDNFLNLAIKPEPCHLGYGDELHKQQAKIETNKYNKKSNNTTEIGYFEGTNQEVPNMDKAISSTESLNTNDKGNLVKEKSNMPLELAETNHNKKSIVKTEINHNEEIDEEQSYISTLNFNNLNIKHERELDICDELFCTPYNSFNENISDSDNETASSAEEAQETPNIFQENIRIYGELDPPLLEEDPETKDPMSASSSQTIIITNVYSHAEVPRVIGSHGELKDATTHSDVVSAPVDNESLAQPVVSILLNDIDEEEHQNVLNHELYVQQTPSVTPEQAIATHEVQVEGSGDDDQPTGSGSGGANASVSVCLQNEETENRINEQQQQQEQQLHLRCQNDDSNINEIAENNNNANIERELQDDANAAQEHFI